MKYSQVKAVDYCDKYDSLNNKDLKSGERIEALFPDGSVELHTIRTEKGHGSEQIDTNRTPHKFMTSKVYLELMVKGVIIRIYLRRSEIRIRRI